MKSKQPLRLLIGSGRLHTHLSHYFRLLSLPFLTWHRSQSFELLQTALTQADQVWILISDSQIEKFFIESVAPFKKSTVTIVHCSGALNIAGTVDLHPLMTFGPTVYALEKYREIHFVSSTALAKSLLKDVENSVHIIQPEQKAFYHALCVCSGNFTTLLWQEAARGFARLELAPEVWQPYLRQITENILQDANSALTGPLARGDQQTIDKNIRALAGLPLQNIYKAFVQTYLNRHRGSL